MYFYLIVYHVSSTSSLKIDIIGLWNHVFLFSNLSLFVLLPFSYLFAESSGFFGHRKGIISRAYETFTVFSLLAVVVLGITYVVSAFIYPEKRGLQTLLSEYKFAICEHVNNLTRSSFNHFFRYLFSLSTPTDLGSYHLPFLYSCVSFIGVVLLLLCTPLGFIRLFGVVGQVLVKPTTRDINEELHASYLEEASVLRKLENIQYNQTLTAGQSKNAATSKYCDINSIPKAFNTIAHSVLRNRLSPSYFTATATAAATAATAATVTVTAQVHTNDLSETDSKAATVQRKNSYKKSGGGGGGTTEYYNSMESEHLYDRLCELTCERKELDKLRKSTGIQRNLVYPLAMLMLLFLTGITVLVVVQNMLELLIGIKALPLSTRVIIRETLFKSTNKTKNNNINNK